MYVMILLASLSSLAVGVHWAVWPTVLCRIRCYILCVFICVCVCVYMYNVNIYLAEVLTSQKFGRQFLDFYCSHKFLEYSVVRLLS